VLGRKHFGELLEPARLADDVLGRLLEAQIKETTQDVFLDPVLRVLQEEEQIRHGAGPSQHQTIFLVDGEIGHHAGEMKQQHVTIWVLVANQHTSPGYLVVVAVVAEGGGAT
jgi:hypothetical protein